MKYFKFKGINYFLLKIIDLNNISIGYGNITIS